MGASIPAGPDPPWSGLATQEAHPAPGLRPAAHRAIRLPGGLALEDLLALQPLLQAIDQNRVTRYVIPYPDITQWWEPGTGYYFLIPHTEAIQNLLQEAVGIP